MVFIPVVPEDQKITKLSFDASSIIAGSLASISSTFSSKSNKFTQPSDSPKQTIVMSLFDAYFDLFAPLFNVADSSGVQIKSFTFFKSSN